MIVGTSVGAGMLALPVVTAQAGFFPSISLFFFTWALTISSAFLFLEALLAFPSRMNYISLSRNLLGKRFTTLVFAFYILLFYSLIAAYTKGIGVIFSDTLSFTSSPQTGSLLFIACCLPILSFGTHAIGKANSLLLFTMLGAFVLLVAAGLSEVQPSYLAHQNWSLSIFSLPLIISSFGFHGTLPSLVDYLNRDKKKIQSAIVIGSTITLAIYLIWQFTILGSVPLTGEISLIAALEQDQTAISPLSLLSKHPRIWDLSHLFSLTAIVTSFFGVSIGLIDFLVDAFKLPRTFYTRTLLLSLICFSALLLTYTDLRIFYLSLNYGAGAAGIFLLILLPAIFAFRIRQLYRT